MTPTLPILQAILLQSVKDMGYADGLQINGFAVIDKLPDFGHVSFGYDFSGHQARLFWGRAWAGGGSSSEQVQGEYPVLMPDLDYVERDGPGRFVYHLSVLLADRLMGLHCHTVRPGAVVTARLLEMWDAVIKNVLEYQLYDVAGLGQVWAHPTRADRSWTELDELADYLTFTPRIRTYPTPRDMRGIVAQLQLKVCTTSPITFVYDRPEPETVGIINCHGQCL